MIKQSYRCREGDPAPCIPAPDQSWARAGRSVSGGRSNRRPSPACGAPTEAQHSQDARSRNTSVGTQSGARAATASPTGTPGASDTTVCSPGRRVWWESLPRPLPLKRAKRREHCTEGRIPRQGQRAATAPPAETPGRPRPNPRNSHRAGAGRGGAEGAGPRGRRREAIRGIRLASAGHVAVAQASGVRQLSQRRWTVCEVLPPQLPASATRTERARPISVREVGTRGPLP